MRQVRNSVLALVLLLCACAQVGVNTPQSTSEKVGYAYATLATVRTTGAQLLASNTIKQADAQSIQALADQARVLLDGANTALATDATTAASKLELATAILTQLQTYLNTTKGAK